MTSYLPSSSGWDNWCSARTLNTLWALGVKLCKTMAAVLAVWVVLPCARIIGKNIPSTLYGAKVGTWYQHQLNCVWTIFLSHTVKQIRTEQWDSKTYNISQHPISAIVQSHCPLMQCKYTNIHRPKAHGKFSSPFAEGWRIHITLLWLTTKGMGTSNSMPTVIYTQSNTTMNEWMTKTT